MDRTYPTSATSRAARSAHVRRVRAKLREAGLDFERCTASATGWPVRDPTSAYALAAVSRRGAGASALAAVGTGAMRNDLHAQIRDDLRNQAALISLLVQPS